MTAAAGAGGGTSGSLTYTYLSDGTKVSAIREDGSGKRYLGSAVYSVPESLGESGGGGSETLESVAWDEGRIFFDVEVPVDSTGNGLVVVDSIPGVGCYRDCWYVTDHLGNVRSVVDISSSLASPQVVERNDYLPYGTRLGVGNAVLESNHYRLGGKEEQSFGSLDLGKIDFSARMYDPFIAGWTTIDPMGAKYGSLSPYSYCAGHPIRFIDPDGRDWVDADGKKIKNHSKIKAYIFYDPRGEGSGFAKQSKEMYNQLEAKYGKGSVAMSSVTTEKEFIQDWGDMASGNIKEVNLNYHGNNQTIMLNSSEGEYITATGNGETNKSGTPATNVQDLPIPSGNISNAQLNLNTCESNSRTQYELKGSGQTLMEAFYELTNFKVVRGTSSGVSYDRKSQQPFPGHSWWRGNWDYKKRPTPVPQKYPGVGLPPE